MHATTVLTSTEASALAATVFAQLEDAWNRADGAGFGVPFTDDADFVDIRGDHHQTKAVIALGHQAIFDSVYAGSTVRYEVETARPVAPGVIVAVAAATLDVPGGPLQGTHRSRATITLVEESDRWAAASFHNTLRLPQG
jgi:uncharacterized protein (TIGR02246 family)